jgi:hypothetical protein
MAVTFRDVWQDIRRNEGKSCFAWTSIFAGQKKSGYVTIPALYRRSNVGLVSRSVSQARIMH